MADTSALIQRWQEGDERAAEMIYNHTYESAYHLAYGLLGHPADAEEAAQDALTYALTRIHRYNPRRAGFNTWLHAITVSRCRDRQRRRRLSSFPLTRWLQRGGDAPDSAPTPEHHAVQAETRDEVWTAVQTLKPDLREAVVLRYWAGHTYQDMADILDCPLRTVQSRVRSAYQQLRVKLTSNQLINLEEDVQ